MYTSHYIRLDVIPPLEAFWSLVYLRTKDCCGSYPLLAIQLAKPP